MKRVLHLIPTLGGGGAERQLTYLCSALSASGWECHVAYLQGGPNLEALENTDAALHRLTANSNYDPKLLWDIRKLIRSIEPDVIQTWITMMDILGGVARLGTGIPWVISERNVLSGFTGLNKVRLVQLLSVTADSVVANSEAGIAGWRSTLPARSIRKAVIPNVVPVERIREGGAASRSSLSLDERPLILFAGRLEPQKNIEVLLESISIALRKRPEARAVLLGDGSLRARAEEVVRSGEFADRIELLGFSDEIWGWMAAASVFVSLSRFEGMPNTVVEAAALECPLVLSDIEPHRGLFDETEVAFVPISDVENAAEAILEVLNQGNLVRSRSARALAKVRAFTSERAAAAYAHHYEEILQSRHSLSQTRGGR